MQALGGDKPQPIAKAPKTRVCYICGRQYGLSSYDIHLKQCKDLWIAREELKPPRERKRLPDDPTLTMSQNDSLPAIAGRTQSLTLDEVNALASTTFNTESMSTCEFCGRTFLAEKLVIHNRSCTVDKPARRVADSVRRGKEEYDAAQEAPLSSTRPKTAGERISKEDRAANPRPPASSPHVQKMPSMDRIREQRSADTTAASHGGEQDKRALMRRIETMESAIAQMVHELDLLKKEVRDG